MESARHTSVAIQGTGFALDGVVTTPHGATSLPAVVVCHPHPHLGGNMDNAVVVAVCSALADAGIATLRFNFRAGGPSEGSARLERTAVEDLLAAVEMLSAWPGVMGRRVGLAGYSFGAAAILNVLPAVKGVRAFAFVSPPVRSVEQAMKALRQDRRRMLFVVGEADRLVSAASLRSWLEDLPSVAFQSVPGADHSWRLHEQELATLVAEFLGRELRNASR